jgi:hypothetical protein
MPDLASLALALAVTLGIPHPSPRVLSAAVAAVSADSRPLEGSPDLELAVMIVYAARESQMQERPRPWVDPRTGRAVDPHAVGAWQIRGAEGLNLRDQAKRWLYLAHAGEAICPAHPLAPLSGGCGRAWRLADRRVAEARAALDRVMVGGE